MISPLLHLDGLGPLFKVQLLPGMNVSVLLNDSRGSARAHVRGAVF